MSFSQALSGLNAQSQKLGAIGNNIANSQTVGFKSSNVQFADVFANSRVGLGTQVSAVLQNFNEGNIESTNRNLDLAVAGEGFFRFQQPSGEVAYSRNGQLTMTAGGELINAQGAQIMGYGLNANGELQVGGQPVPLSVSAENLAARATEVVSKEMNLDARVVAGSDLNEAQVVTNMANPSSPAFRENLDYHYSNSFTAFDSLGNPRNVQIYYEKRVEGENAWLGKVVMDGYYDMAMDPVGEAGELVVGAAAEAQQVATDSVGELQQAMIALDQNLAGLQNAMRQAAADAAADSSADADIVRNAVNNAAQQFISSGGATLSEVLTKYLSEEEFGEAQESVLEAYLQEIDMEAAGDAAAVLDAVEGGDYLTSTGVKIATDNFVGSLSALIVGNVPSEYSAVAQSALNGLDGEIQGAADFDEAVVASNAFVVNADDDTFNAIVASINSIAASVTAGESNQDIVDGVQGILDVVEVQPIADGISALVAAAGEAAPEKSFDAFGTNDFVVEFDQNGTLKRVGQPQLSDDNQLSYVDVAGNRPVINFASNGQTPLGGATEALQFEINLAGTTQFGNSSGVNTLTQDGYTSGSLVGITIEDDGTIMRNYSNEQSLAAGQVALANFRNPEGLNPIGDNLWTATQTSGQELVGAAGTGMLGGIVAGAVETSNVDMAGELVNMIIAQRAYQANSQTISTQDELLQTIINL